MSWIRSCLMVLCVTAGWWAPLRGQSVTATLQGQITDPSGAAVPAALVQVLGGGKQWRGSTVSDGTYQVAGIKPGIYTVRVIAKGFTVALRREVEIREGDRLDVQLTIESEAQVVNVEAEANRVSVDPTENSGALVLGEKQLAALSDDPDELEEQLKAMAGPAAGPNGGEIYIDGFSGGRLPPKASIREVRINSNPYSTEYDRPGFGRIEIFTKPGLDSFRGQAFFQFNDESLNSRNPLLTQSKRSPYQQRFYGVSLSGPIKKERASFSFDFERRAIDENALILATTVDRNFGTTTTSRGVLTPQIRTTFTPRVDVTLSPNNTLTMRYQEGRTDQENEGIGDFSLESRAYTQKDNDRTFQVTDAAVLSPKIISESRFQYARSELNQKGDNSTPALSVQGAFDGGGAQIGHSGNLTNSWEGSNITTRGGIRHTYKFGGRVRYSRLEDTSQNNFGGTYIFFGGLGPELDGNNRAVAGTNIQLTALERYRRTLLFQSLGYDAATIRSLGGGASQLSLSAGLALSRVNQFDAGLFFNDDWKVRQNFTLSYGLRWETQTNIRDYKNFAPRVGIAWGLGRNGSTKTVLRAGFGIFYDRVSNSVTLNADRYNGATQRSYLLQNPDTFPLIPAESQLQAAAQPQRLQIKDARLVAPRNYQASISLERQLNSFARVSVQYIESRGVHLQRTRNINTAVDGAFPYGDAQLRVLTETTGLSRTHMLVVAPNANYKGLFLFGFYMLGFGRSDAEGNPANPYNLRAEYGPSDTSDVRHRVVIGSSVNLRWKISVSPFLLASAGSPYNITTGRDTNRDGFTSERPALVKGLSEGSCQGSNLIYEKGFGCFDLNPAAGTSISRNYGRGPATVTLNLRLARSWAFGGSGESGIPGGLPAGMGGLRGMGGPPAGAPPPGGGGPGGPGGPFGGSSGRRYNLTLSVSARNLLNTSNFASPSGDLSSPYFGQSRSLAGFGPFGSSTTYNRKIDVQLRFTF